MLFIYTFFIRIYSLAIGISSLFNSKAKQWINGRKYGISEIQKNIELKKSNSEKTIWIHCASLGEFEQGRPLIEKLKKQYPNQKIVLTFFSPSGYEIRKNYEGADFVFYLPEDTPSNASSFISIINPQAVFFVKYEFWFNYLNELKKRNIPTYLVSGIFRPNHYFFKWYGAWGKKQLSCFTHFFVQNEASKKLLNAIGYNNTTITGDTRFDRVFEICNNVKSVPHLADFKKNTKIIVAGSTWKQDEELLSTLDFKSLDFKLIIAPHEVNEAHIQSIESMFEGISDINTLRYSKANEHNIKSTNVLIIDSIGLLSSLYQYGEIAYIGGGFGKGIHNILEAATFGLPVIFGPNYQKFAEAVELIKLQGASSINNVNELQHQVNKLTQTAVYQNTSSACKSYILENVGATDKILSQIKL
jgi:3-deoxy-D-manno-octulosonic-acid transferase